MSMQKLVLDDHTVAQDFLTALRANTPRTHYVSLESPLRDWQVHLLRVAAEYEYFVHVTSEAAARALHVVGLNSGIVVAVPYDKPSSRE